MNSSSDYTIEATRTTPALIIYVLDVSSSMEEKLGSKKRIDVVTEALQAALKQMIWRATKGRTISPRYRIAMYAYSDKVFDLMDGIQGIDMVARKGTPRLPTQRLTDTASAFKKVEELLTNELPNLKNCPAPLVCHMTDGLYTGEDPEPIAKRIMKMRVPDGNVLIENIFISDKILNEPINNAQSWKGINQDTKLKEPYAEKLRAISSPLPTSYQIMMHEYGYQLEKNALMFLPGMSPELVRLGFVMSGATGSTR